VDCRVLAEITLPHVVAQENDERRPRLPVLRSELPPENGLDLKGLESIGRHERTVVAHGSIQTGDVDRTRIDPGKMIQTRLLRLEIGEVVGGQPDPVVGRSRLDRRDSDDPLLVGKGQAPVDGTVHEAEHQGGHADPEADGENRRCRQNR